MSKIVITYAIFSLLLFGALFAAFFISGLGEPSEDWNAVAEPAEEGATAPKEEIPAYVRELDYPALESGRIYRISHPTKLYVETDTSSESETLPARGFVSVFSTEDVDSVRWYTVFVSDGTREYTRYILAKDLNFKRVIPQYSADEVEDQRMQEVMAQLTRAGEQRRAAQLAAEPPPPPEDRVPQSFDEWWSMTASRMGGTQPAQILASAIAAAVGTVLCIGSMFMLTGLRRENTWSRTVPADLDAEWEEARGDDEEDADDYRPLSGGTDDRW